jgi:probable rRNA maturation factor
MLEIKKTVRNNPPINGLFLTKIKDNVLGKNYSLSLVFIGDKLSKKLNYQYRQKDKPTDILSFPLSENEGEIFINLKYAKKEAPLFKKNYKDFIVFLFIHGLLHLKGLQHSSRMNKEEERIFKKFVSKS